MSNCTSYRCFQTISPPSANLSSTSGDTPTISYSKGSHIISLVALGVLSIFFLFMVSSFIDKRCCCCFRSANARSPPTVVALVQAPVSRKDMGLLGLKKEERRLILEHILMEAPFSSGEIESNIPTTDTLESETILDGDETELGCGDDISLNDGYHHDSTLCAICLCDYGKCNLLP
jgi:hypothetical protein